MSFTAKVVINNARIKNDGTYPLILRVTFYRKIIKLPLGHCIRGNDWDEKNQKIKSNSKVTSNVTRLNNQLKKRQAEIYDQLSNLEMQGELQTMSTKELKIILTNENQNTSILVYDYIDKLIAEKISAGKKGTALTYQGLKRKLESIFGDSLGGFKQIDYNALVQLETIHLSKGHGYGGLSVYLRALRSIYNRAIKEKIIDEKFYPFKEYSIRKGETQRRALSESDFNLLKNYDFKFPLKQGKDYYLASFYMRGINFIDMAYLRVGNIQGDFERIRYQRNKTRKYFSIKISEPLRKILKNYILDPNEKTAFIFPILKKGMSSEREYETIKNKRQRLNEKLHKIANLLEIGRFTIYSARHTYATMGKRKGVPTAIIQESLGHETEAITQKYLDSFENDTVDKYDELIML